MAKREAGGADTYGRWTTLRRSVWCALLFAAVCIGGVFLHELGHAVGGWLQGIAVVPTPAKEYILRAQVDWQEMTWIALGGVAATGVLVRLPPVDVDIDEIRHARDLEGRSLVDGCNQRAIRLVSPASDVHAFS